MTTSFQTEIRGLRAALSLTQHELATMLDVRSQSVCNWEAGRSKPWPKKQDKIIKQLQARLWFDRHMVPRRRVSDSL